MLFIRVTLVVLSVISAWQQLGAHEMLIFFMPDWMLNAKPNCNGILQNVGKVNMLQKIYFLMFGYLSYHQDCFSTYHWVRQLSTVFRAKNGTGLSVSKLRSCLGSVTDTLYSLILSKAVRNNDMYYSPNIHMLPQVFHAPCN